MSSPPKSGKGERRIASLGGLRGISIALVLLAHMAGTRNFLSTDVLHRIGDTGNFGVRIFFVISGYLITTLLLDELEAAGSISLKNFYVRRTLRIFPAFYFFVFWIILANAVGWIQLNSGDILHAVTYTINFDYVRSWNVGHLWSLAVEEQFYLLWPMVLALRGRRSAMFVAAAVICAAPMIRVGIWLFVPSQREGIDTMFPTVADALGAGCLLALLSDWLGTKPKYIAFLRSPLFVAIPVAAVLANLLIEHPRIAYPIGLTVMNISLALFIDRCVRFPRDWFGRLLNSAPLEFVGVLSYSLYLWQQPFLNRNSEALVNAFPLNIILASTMAFFSYRVVEKPFLKLRKRFGRSNEMQQLAAQRAVS